MTWMRTHRQWGNGRTIRGVAHYMVWTGDGTVEGSAQTGTGLVALCGYVPHEKTKMWPESVTRDLLDRDRCRSCVAKEKRL